MPALPRPSTRVLAGCVVGFSVLLAALAAIDSLDAARRLQTPLGTVAWPELAAVALSMSLGGYVARAGFRWLAVALVATSGLVSLAIAWMSMPPGVPGMGAWLARHFLFALVLELGVAWLAALVGERIAAGATSRRAAVSRA